MAGISIPSLNVNSNIVTEDSKLAEALNMHILSVSPKVAGLLHLSKATIHLGIIKSNESATFVLKPVTRSQVMKKTSSKW